MTAAAPRWSTGLCAGKRIILAWPARHVWNPSGCNQPYTWPVVNLLDLCDMQCIVMTIWCHNLPGFCNGIKLHCVVTEAHGVNNLPNDAETSNLSVGRDALH